MKIIQLILTRILFLLFFILLHISQVFSQSCNAGFSFVITGCNAVSFVPDTLNPTFTYTWDFGDSNTSNEQNPTHNYFSFGAGTADFNVSLTVDGPDCNETSTMETVTVDQVPDPSIADASGQGFINCVSGFLNVQNTSTTTGTNTNYSIQWGDNTPDFNATSFNNQPHVYTTPGQYDIIIAVTGSNNCVSVDTIPFIFSATPNIGAALESNSPICLPGSAPIQIVGVQNNTPNTVYIVQANDGSDPLVFNHPPPSLFDYPLDSTACGTTSMINNNTFNNAFQVSITAETGCPNQSASAAVGPIRTINSPEADFEILPDTLGCVGDLFQFNNTSMDGLFYDPSSDMCLSNMGVIWDIFPSTGYTITGGSLVDSMGFSAEFQAAGIYTIQLIVENNIFNTPSDYDPFCRGDTIQKSICILPEPNANFTIDGNNGCFPLIVSTTNMSNTLNTCSEATYTWEVDFVESECGNLGSATFIDGTGQNDLDVVIQFDSSGLYELLLIVENECGIDTMMREIEVAASPLTLIRPIPDTCFYGPLSIQPSIATTAGCYATPTYNWSFPGSDTPIFNGEMPPVITYNMPGVYTISLSTTNDCGTRTTSETFELFPLPEVPDIGHNSPLCVGGTIQFSNPNHGDLFYEWSGPDDFTSNDPAPSIMDATLANSGTYSLTVTDPNTNCFNTESYQIEVTLNAPLAVTPNPAELCIGQSVTLTATGATNYAWSPDTYLNTTSGSTVIVTPTEIGTFEYIVMGVDNILCNGMDTVTVIVHPLPVVSAGEDQVVCVNTNFQLEGFPSTAEGTDAYWTGPNVSSSGLFNAANPDTYTVIYHFQDGNLCEDSSSVNICVIPEPLASFTVDETFGCNTLMVQTTNTSNTLGNCETAEYNWAVRFNGADCHAGSGMWNFSNGDANSESPGFSFTQTGVYEIELTLSNQCGVSTSTEVITIGSGPEVSIDSIADACEMLVIHPTFEALACNALVTDYVWSFPGGIPADFNGANPPAISYNQPGDYTISLTVTNSCGSFTDTESFRILDGPDINLNLSDDFACVGDVITVENNSTGDDLLYEWIVSGPGVVEISDPLAAEPTLTFPDTGLYVISVEIGNSVCSGLTWTAEVLVSQLPTANLEALPDFCESATFTPSATYSDINRIDSVQWIFPAEANMATSTDFDPGEITIGMPGDYTIQVLVYNGCGVDSSSQSFRVLEGPVIAVALDTTFACVGDVITVENNSTGDDLLYEWMVSGPGSVEISDPLAAEPTLTFPDTGLYVITVEIGNSVCSGLTWTAEVLVSQPPTANLGALPDFCESATFTPSATYSDISRIDSVRWVFPAEANMATSTDFDPGEITIGVPGDYTIQVLVYNGCGADSSSQSFRVLEGPVIAVALDTTFACVGNVITVENNSTGDDLLYEWMVNGPGSVEISDPLATEPTLTFPDTGLYVITVEISNSVCTGLTWTAEVLVSQPPTANLGALPDFCESATFTPSATYSDINRIDSVRWIFPAEANMATSTDFDPGEITIGMPGDYTIQVLVYNGCGVDSSSQRFRVLEGPVIAVALDTTFACVGDVIAVENNSTGDDLLYEWMVNGPGVVEISDPLAAEPTLTFPDTGLYVITVEISNPVCSGLTWTAEVLVSQLPTANLAALPDFCESATFTPSATYSDINRIDSVRWVFPAEANMATSTDFDPGEITIGMPGDYTIQVWVYNGCGADSSSQSFRVLEGPVIAVALDTTFACVGDVITVENNSTGDDLLYEWMVSGPGVVEISDPMAAEPTLTFPDTGLYVITVDIGNSVCSGLTWTAEVLVSQQPTANLGALPDFCESATFTPSATYSDINRIDSVRWIFPAEANMATSTDFDPGEITIAMPGDYTIQVLVYNGCGADSSSQNFRVLEGPVIAVALDTTFACVGDVITVENNSTGDDLLYEWMVSGPGVVEISDPFAAEPTLTFPDTGLYVITVEIGNSVCSGLTWTAEVLISQQPTANLEALPDFCESATFTPSATYSDINRIDSVRWVFPAEANIATSTDFDPGEITIGMPGDYTIQVLVYNGCGVDSSSQRFRVLEGPVIAVSLDTTFACVGDVITVENNSTGDDLLYEWMVSGPGSVEFSDPMAAEPTLTFPDTGLYVITVEIGNSVCSGLTWTAEVLVSQLPTANLEALPDFCESATFTPSATYSDINRIDSVRWVFPAEANMATSTDFDPGEITIGMPGDYTIQVLVYNGCGTDSSSQSFRVLEGPVIAVSLDTTFACVGNVITVENNSTGDDLLYEWMVSGPGVVEISDPLAAEPTLTFPDTGLYVISVEISNPVCSGLTWTAEVLVSQLPTANLEALPDFCESATFTPSATYSDINRIDSVRWVFPAEANMATSTDFDPGEITIGMPGDYTIQVWVYNGCGVDSSSQSFRVLEGPVIAVALDSTFACVGDVIAVENNSTGDDLLYEWMVNGPGVVEISDPLAAEPTLTFPDTGLYVITVEIGNSVCSGLTWTAEVLVSQLPTANLEALPDFCESATFTPSATYSDISRIDSVRWVFPAEANMTTSTDFDPGEITIGMPGDYTIQVLVYNGCGVDSSSQSFRVLEGPVIAAALDTTFACVGDVITVENNSTGDDLLYEWMVSGPGVVEISDPLAAEPTLTFPDTGLYVITVEIGNSVCSGLTWTAEVLVSQLPTANLEALPDFCESATFTPSATYSDINRIDSVRWIFPAEANMVTSTDFDPGEITIGMPGDYTIQVWVYNGCGADSSSQSFRVLEGPMIAVSLDTTFACVGDVITVENNSTGDDLLYEWMVSGPGVVEISDPLAAEPTLTFPDTGLYVITVEIGNSVCSGLTWTAEVLVSQLPTANLGALPDFCDEASITPQPTYSDTSRIDSIRWLFPGGSPETSTDYNPGEITYSEAGNYTISLIAYNGCGSDTSSQSFSVFEPIMVGAELSDDFSCGLPFVVEANNQSSGDSLNYGWSVTGPFADNVLFDPTLRDPTFTFQDTGIYIISLSVFNDICGELSWEDTVQIMMTPELSLTGIDNFCEEVSLTPVVDYGISRIDSVLWSFPGGMPPISTELMPTGISYSGAGTFTYSVTAFNLCGATTVDDTFVIDTIPEIDLGPTDTICITDGTFQVAEAMPSGGEWRDSLGRSGIITATGLFDPVIAGGGVTTIEYVFTAGACEISAFKHIFVVDLSFVDGGPDLSTCISETMVVLDGGMPLGGWYEGPGVFDPTGLFNPNSVGIGEYVITYNYRLPGTDCIGTDQFVISVHPLPIPVISVTDSICVNVPVQLGNNSLGATSYEWLITNAVVYNSISPVHTFTDTGIHTIQLIATSEFGCLDSTSTEVFVSGPPEARFSMDTTMGCAVLPVTFTNESIGFQFANYDWDFGNGMSSTAVQPGTISFDQGLRDTMYVVTLTTTNHCGEDQHLDSILVLPLPLAAIDVSQDQGCSPLEVEFNNLTQGLPDSFLWDLGLGGDMFTDSIPPPQVYLAPDSVNVLYTINFYAFNECGIDSATQQILVQPNFIRAFFSADENVGCEPFTVNFSNSTSPDSVIVYDWFFGNGDTSTEEDPSYTFYAQGDTTTVYEVTLVANNGCARDSLTIPITVHPAPRVSFEPPPVTCAKDTVFFTNTSIEAAGHFWEFGDGSTSEATNPGHLYVNPGEYEVTLTAFAIGTGCPNTYIETITIRDIPSPDLIVAPLFGCPPLTVNLTNQSSDAVFYNWDFGDGNSTVGANPGSHIYTESGVFDIHLTATDEFGCSNDATFSSVQVYPVPVAAFTPIREEPCGVPVTICMENQSQGGFGFSWNLGNGESSTENNPCTIYEAPGEYTIGLTVTNEFLCTTSISQLVTVYGEPEAAFSLRDTLICSNEEVQFINESLNATFAEWIFSDGIITTDWDPIRVFADTGSYDVTLIVGNESGCNDTLRLENYFEVFPSPIAAFAFDELDNELPTTIAFTDLSSGDASSFWWDFDDGQTSIEQNPIHRYLSSFDKLVTHAVANAYGCTDTVTAWVNLDTLGGLFIPNIFEPEDLSQFEKNVFQPKGIGLSEYHIAIFARNGQLVWESTSLNEEGMPDEAWDGTFRGALMPPGAYVWKVFLARFLNGTHWDGMPDEKKVPRRSGFVYLVR